MSDSGPMAKPHIHPDTVTDYQHMRPGWNIVWTWPDGRQAHAPVEHWRHGYGNKMVAVDENGAPLGSRYGRQVESHLTWYPGPE